MTKAETIRKLANAIRDYRGLTAEIPQPGKPVKWKTPPNKGRQADIHRYTDKLKLSQEYVMNKVDSFVTREEFDKWIGSLSTPGTQEVSD